VDKAFWVSFAKHFDTDGNGAINRVEFGAMIGAIHPTLTEQQISEMVPALPPPFRTSPLFLSSPIPPLTLTWIL
jgi:hypothetical protein